MALTQEEQFASTQLLKEREYKRGWRAGYKNGYNSAKVELKKAQTEVIKLEAKLEDEREEMMSPKEVI